MEKAGGKKNRIFHPGGADDEVYFSRLGRLRGLKTGPRIGRRIFTQQKEHRPKGGQGEQATEQKLFHHLHPCALPHKPRIRFSKGKKTQPFSPLSLSVWITPSPLSIAPTTPPSAHTVSHFRVRSRAVLSAWKYVSDLRQDT